MASQAITDPTTYSEEMWFNTTTAEGGFLMGFGSSPSGLSSDGDRQVWMSDDGQLNFGVFTGEMVTVQSPGSYNDGNWHYVVATQGPTSQSQSYVGYWRVGADNVDGWPDQPTSNYFGGTISDVAFYNTELSVAQVQAHYQASPAA